MQPEHHAPRPPQPKAARVKGSKAAPLALALIVAILGGGAAGATHLAMQAQEEEPLVQAYENAPEPAEESLDMVESAVPQHADDVTMTLNGDADTILLAGEEYLEAGCHAVQAGVGDITDSVKITGDAHGACGG